MKASLGGDDVLSRPPSARSVPPMLTSALYDRGACQEAQSTLTAVEQMFVAHVGQPRGYQGI